MPAGPERTVPGGAIATALETTELLAGRDQDVSAVQGTGSLRHAVDLWGADTMTNAYGLIIHAAMSAIKPASDMNDDNLHIAVPALLTRFHRMHLPEVPDDELPLVAGLLTAACYGLNVYDWRLRLGPLRRGEPLVWCYVTWLLINFIDEAVYEQPGLFADILRKVLITGPDNDE